MARPQHMAGHVYVASHPMLGVKIGFTRFPKQRAGSIHPATMQFVTVLLPNALECESEVLRRLSKPANGEFVSCPIDVAISEVLEVTATHPARLLAAFTRPGAPPWKAPSAEMMRAAKAVWLNHRDFDTNMAALEAIEADAETFGGPWSITRLHREFGGSGRPLKGRRKRDVVD